MYVYVREGEKSGYERGFEGNKESERKMHRNP